MFAEKGILRRKDTPYSPDFLLWGYLKSQVYNNKAATTVQLKEDVREEMCQQVFTNLSCRFEVFF